MFATWRRVLCIPYNYHKHLYIIRSERELERPSPRTGRHKSIHLGETGRRMLRRYRFVIVLQREEVLQQLLAGFGEHGFGMELDAFEFIAAVADAHDDAFVSLRGNG
jgi:hypothetical protein